MLPYRDSRLTYIALGIFFLIVIDMRTSRHGACLRSINLNRIARDRSARAFHHDKGSGRSYRFPLDERQGHLVTETGTFEEPYLLAPDTSVVLDARDKYGRSRSKVIEIVYTPTTTNPDIIPAAATSASSTGSVAH